MKLHIKTLLEQASRYHQDGELAQAKEIYKILLQQSPCHPDANHQLGLLYVQLQKLEEAIHFLSQAVEKKPRSTIFRNNLANALLASRRFDEAIQHYQHILLINPDYAQAYNNMGSAYFRQKNYSEAAKNFQQALVKNPNYGDASYNLGVCLFKEHHLDEAMAQFIQTIMLNPNHVQAQYYLANCYYLTKEYSLAIMHYQKVLEYIPEDIEANYNLANSYLKQADFIKACTLWEYILDLNPNYIDAIYNLAVIHSVHQDFVYAIELFQRVLAINDEHVSSYYNLAWVYTRLGDYEKACKMYQSLLKIFPNDASLKYLITAMEGVHQPETAPAEYIKQFFNYYAQHYDAHLEKLNYQVPFLFEKTLDQYIDKKLEPDSIALDLGCGTGLNGDILKHYVDKLIGVDLSANMLEIAQTKKIYNELVQGDFRDALKSFSQEINLIAAADAFVYVGDLKEIIFFCAQSLVEQGILIFNTETWLHQENYKVQATGRFAHAPNYIISLLQQTNFKLLNHQSINLRLQQGIAVDGNIWCAQLDCKH